MKKTLIVWVGLTFFVIAVVLLLRPAQCGDVCVAAKTAMAVESLREKIEQTSKQQGSLFVATLPVNAESESGFTYVTLSGVVVAGEGSVVLIFEPIFHNGNVDWVCLGSPKSVRRVLESSRCKWRGANAPTPN